MQSALCLLSRHQLNRAQSRTNMHRPRYLFMKFSDMQCATYITHEACVLQLNLIHPS